MTRAAEMVPDTAIDKVAASRYIHSIVVLLSDNPIFFYRFSCTGFRFFLVIPVRMLLSLWCRYNGFGYTSGTW